MTEELHVEQVLVTHRHAWRKWPDTDDGDYSSVLAERRPSRYDLGGGVFLNVTERTLPAYLGHVRAGHRVLPDGVPFPWINNTRPPASAVLDAQRAALAEAAAECRVLVWDHAHQCFPDVAAGLPAWFRLSILMHADDCPGSSELKTFPVAPYFDALYHQMLVWDDRTGVRVADKYKALGTKRTYFLPMGPSAGLEAGLTALGADVREKAARVASGALAPSLVFVGFAPRDASRRAAELAAAFDARRDLGIAGITSKFHGVGCSDGQLPGRAGPEPGRALAPLYHGATFGLNAPVSSIFNSRLMDLWISGVAQVVHDVHGELAELGFLPGQHFIAYDGSTASLRAELRRWTKDRAGLAALVLRAHSKAREFLAANTPTTSFARIYRDHADRLRP